MKRAKYVPLNHGICPICERFLMSLSRHNFDSCKCGNFVDGGFDYMRETVGLKKLPLYWKVEPE